MLHGLEGFPAQFNHLTTSLRAKGFWTFRPAYPSTHLTIQGAAKFLMEKMLGRTKGPWIVVAHSLGGLVARCWWSGNPPQAVLGTVYLAVPHLGSPLADTAEKWAIARALLGPVLGQITHAEAAVLTQLPHLPGPALCIAGNLKKTVYGEDGDHVVTFTSATTLPGSTSEAFPLDHNAIPGDPHVVRRVVEYCEALRDGVE